ncbi:MAG: hypothetical protein HY084_06155 [Gemmatimonadetes bacterium]|nr:hypothetical protein [Gemmatimonadota bacterium]
MPDIPSLFRRWLPFAFLGVTVPLLVYVAVQQSQRNDANDPQLQIAEDLARALERGVSAAQAVPAGAVDVAESLAPFAVVYDARGTPVAGNGTLRGRLPAPPDGVFSFVREHGEERVTWMPERTVRLAAVVRRTTANGGGFVLAARSLREVEQREHYTMVVCAGMIVVLTLGSLALLAMGDAVLGMPG